MDKTRGSGPFRPGTGALPPYLAGREEEQALLREKTEDLLRGDPPGLPVVLYGPRGNGKTALLRWLRRESESLGGLEIDWLMPPDIPTPAEVPLQLQVTSLLGKVTPEAVSLGGVGVSLQSRRDAPRLARALIARAKSKPLLVLLDEAHILKPEVGQLLLNAAQEAANESAFLLILAGTPDLEARLSEMGASFWGRAEKIRLGRLDPNATAEAVRRPLLGEGVAVEDDALARIVRASHGYPFFTQIWGRAVWRVMARVPSADRRMTDAVVEEASVAFETRKNDYYRERYNELRRRNLLPVASAVAAAFLGKSRLTDAEFHDAVQRAATGEGGPNPTEAADALEHLGFVWQTQALPMWEPGIPSLVDYIRNYGPAPN